MANKKVAFKLEVDTSEAMEGVEKTTESVEDLGKATKKTSTEMKGGFKGAAENAKQLGGSLGNAASGAITFVRGLKAMTKAAWAFVATPIGAVVTALVVALGVLKSFFTSTERGAQGLRVGMAAFGAVVSEVRDFVFGLGESLVKLFTLDFSGALDALTDAFVGLGEGITHDIAAVVNLEIALNNLKVATRELSVETAEARAEIKSLNKDAEDVTLSFEKRAAAAQKAADMEADLLSKRLALAEENVRIIKEQNKASESSEEELQKLADAEINLANTRMESLELQTTIQNKLNAIRQAAEAQAKAIEAARQKRHDDEVKRLQEESDLKFSLADKTAKREVEIHKALQDAKIALMEEGEEKEKAAAQLALERRLEGIMGANEIERELRTALEDATEVEIQAIKDKYAAEELAKKKTSDDKLLKQEQATAQARQDVATSLGNVLGSIALLIGNQSREAVIAGKVLAIAQIAIDTAKAVSGAIAAAQAAGPFPANLAAIATGVAAVISGIASATSTLNSTNIPGPSATAPTAPNISASSPSINSVTTNTTELGNTEQAELAPIQAFVVETGITGSQENVNQIAGQATFGGG